jgi:hypothetical protein
LEGGNDAVLLAGLSLTADVRVTEVLGRHQRCAIRSRRPPRALSSSRPMTPTPSPPLPQC